MTEKDFLEHFGIPGMKWGVRNDKKLIRQAKREQKAELKAIKKLAKKAKKKLNKKELEEMSDADLKARIERMQMEKRYRDLSKDEKSEGRKAAETILKNVGIATGTAILTGVGIYAAKKVLEIYLGDDVVKDMFKKK